MANSIPEELQHIQPYIQRSQELYKFDPVVSYFCKYYAARQAITQENASDSAQTFLLQLLDELEHEKAQLQDNDSMKDDTTASEHCTTLGIKVFSGADKEDRDGIATKDTAKNFIVASQLLQILAAFGDIPDKIANIIKYSKWRAVLILRAIREGRQPEPPEDANQEQELPEQAQDLSGQSQEQQQSEQSHTQQNSFTNWPSPPQHQEQSTQQHPTTYQAISSPQPSMPPSAFMPPPQGHTLSPPPQTYSSPQAFSSPPPPPQQSASPLNYPNHQLQQQQPVVSNGGVQHNLDPLPSVPPNRVYTGTPTSAANTPDPYPGAATFIPVPAANIPPVKAPESGGSELVLDPTDAKAAQKLARWAISALEYDDVNTAIENLQKAINVLRPYTNSQSR
ncbi:DUF605-domain-containing protein [Coemansia reversa NRRL 1564]|uniref:DUF605-domain-containing protein n=1 Tax=Coemansia reversa (strain ATCC 12441 / NRRL 1564) TaxID=763665 RepID=A0A2G5BAD9_COERN|nr:DUF605-domain-containing protein [Coemansia reversa NRRL 1564]|eukprot:PIA15978.1 DUF605-domain-containing protein [Coemansia reversa NRRL 1564]